MPRSLQDVLFTFDGICYSRLRVLSWWAGLVEHNKLAGDAGQLIARGLVEDCSSSPFLLNATGIETFDDYALAHVREALRGRSAPFILVHPDAEKTLLEKVLGPATWIQIGESAAGIWGGSVSESDLLRWTAAAEAFEKVKFREWVNDCFVPGEKRLQSTPFRASGVLDARKLIRHPARFVWASALLAEKIQEVIVNAQLGYSRPFRLLAVSLRGSALAVGAALMSGYQSELHVVDHLGPKYRVLEEHTLYPESFSGDYILVSDFVVGGGELRSAMTYAHDRGAVLTHAIALGRSLGEADYFESVTVSALTDIREAVPELRFFFP
jgi:hypothetical protein